MLKVELTILSILFAIGGTLADIAPEPMYSKGIEAFKETRIQMVDEVVYVDLYKSHALVRVEFNMKNHGDETTLQIGFPDAVGGNLFGGGSLTDFVIKVNGKERTYTVQGNSEVKKVAEVENSRAWQWLIWDETFQKEERKKIVVNYRQPFGAVYGSDLLGKRYFQYILETGAGWDKSIERATVIVNLNDGLSAEHIIQTLPTESCTISDRRIRWEFKDLEPTKKDNISVYYRLYKDHEEYVGRHEGGAKEGWVSAWEFAYACNKAGKHDLAIKPLELFISLPDDPANREFPEGRSSMDMVGKDERNKLQQLALYKQLVMARYQLYRMEESEASEEKLLDALNGLRRWAKQDAKAPGIFDQLIPSRDYDAPSHQWLLNEFVMGDSGIADWKRSLGIFKSGWEEMVDIAHRGMANVRLVEQHVNIDFYKDHRNVSAVHYLKNLGVATTVNIKLEDLAGDYLDSDLMSDFRIFIDDTPVPVENKPDIPAEMKRFHWNWKPSWQVVFGEGEQKKIRVTYRVPYDSSDHFGGLLDLRHYQYLYDNSRRWNGAIDRASFAIEFKDMTTAHLERHIQPPATTKTENSLAWEFENWEPTATGRIRIEYPFYEDYADYVAHSRDKKMTLWTDAWRLAYACNKAELYELAAQRAEQGIAIPYEVETTTSVEEKSRRKSSRDTELPRFKQIALYKQLAMARYQLYFEDESEINKLKLQAALDGLKDWATRSTNEPKAIGRLFPNGNYHDPAYQWLKSEFIEADDGWLGFDLGSFGRCWSRRIDEMLHPEPQSETGVKRAVVLPGVAADHFYVSLGGGHTPPFSDWATAATNIQDAVDCALDADTVHVSNGTYRLSDEILVSKKITIESLNGPAVTIVDGGGTNRCFNVGKSACVISGLTITNGFASDYGGGVFSGRVPPCVLTNCAISGNSANSGGGIFNCTAINCKISQNSAKKNGGGMCYGTAINCTISRNSAGENGGGISCGMVNSSTIYSNSAKYGGGTYNVKADDCTINENSASSSGGGIRYGTASNCTINGNSARSGGGMRGGTANNCTFLSNSATSIGGGILHGTANFCTIIRNSAGNSGGGGYKVDVGNSIVWFNLNSDLTSSVAKNSCSPDVEHGVDGNITNVPPMALISGSASNTLSIGAGSAAYSPKSQN